MVSMTRQDFLNFVQCYIQADPEAAAHVADYLQRGLRAALQESNRRAPDMEAALIVLLEKRTKGRNEFLKTILIDILLGLKSEDSSYDARLFASANQLASARFLLHRGV